jgi:hypothetical protein
MSSCIIFAVAILSKDREFVLRRFLETFKSKFPDSDLYIGINPGSIDNIENIINEYNLNTQIAKVDPLLYNKSDASAYQAALKLLYNSGKKYNNYWFVHTKSGVNSHSDYLREWYINNFLSRRNYIENFINMEDIGSYGMLGVEFEPSRVYNETDTEISLFENNISEDLPYTHANFFYIHTIYTLSNKPIEKFFSLITDKWFNSKLDRYYFEGIFPFIVSRSGYFPYIENGTSMNGISLLPHQLNWLNTNQLDLKYNYLIDKSQINYSFNQLRPPYVNSNT